MNGGGYRLNLDSASLSYRLLDQPDLSPVTMLERVDQRQSRFAFSEIIADVFPDHFCRATVVEHIVDQLVCRAEVEPVGCKRLFSVAWHTGQHGSQLGRSGEQLSSLAADDFH